MRIASMFAPHPADQRVMVTAPAQIFTRLRNTGPFSGKTTVNPTYMQKTILTALASLTLFLVSSCKLPDMKDEKAFAMKISQYMNGLPVAVSKGIESGSEEGKFKKFEITIQKFEVTEDIEASEVRAISIPAYLFIKDPVSHTDKLIGVNAFEYSVEHYYFVFAFLKLLEASKQYIICGACFFFWLYTSYLTSCFDSPS